MLFGIKNCIFNTFSSSHLDCASSFSCCSSSPTWYFVVYCC